jgi:hypothetical protein
MTAGEIWNYIFKALGLLTPIVLGWLKLRDMILSNRARVERVEEGLTKLEKQLIDLEQKREKDLIEHNSLRGIATSIDTKIDSKLKDYMRENADARHKDYILFSEALHKVDKTLTEINATLKHLRGDVDSLKLKKQGQ